MPVNLQAIKSPTFILKLVEMLFAIICIGLFAGYIIIDDSLIPDLTGKKAAATIAWNLDRMAMINGTFIGFLIVSFVLGGAIFMDTPPNSILVMVVSVIAAVMFGVAGGFCIDAYDSFSRIGPLYDLLDMKEDNFITAGVFSILNTVVYLVDIFFTYRSAST